jgi:imidazoleglycerol-phosphate dehydratase
MARRVESTRKTRETEIRLTLDMDNAGQGTVRTAVPFFDHILTSMAFHGGFHLDIQATGDLDVDAHHLVEDVGITLGEALAQCVSRHGLVARFGWALIPMDEALAEVALDVCGRPTAALDMTFPQPRVGSFDLALLREFYLGLASGAGMSLHVTLRRGENSHHMAEASFKALGKALAAAYRAAGRDGMSTKGDVDRG